MEGNPTLLIGVGRRIAQIRTARSVTQESLAERVGVAVQTIRRIETGRTNVPLLRLADIARELGVEIGALLDDAGAEVPDPTWDVDSAAVVELWTATPAERRALLLALMKAFTTSA